MSQDSAKQAENRQPPEASDNRLAQDQLAALVGDLANRAEDDPAARAALAALVEAIPPPEASNIRLAPEVPSFAATLWEEWERQQAQPPFTGFSNL
jgi:hypothetical protein